MKEVIIGFDAKQMWKPDELYWDTSRRETFLLKDVEKVLSVDNWCWASVFETLKIQRPAKFGWVQGLWSDLDNLRNYIDSNEALNNLTYWEIAITQFFDTLTLERNGLDMLTFNPSTI